MKKILLLLPRGFELLEAAAFTDVVGWAHDVFKYEVKVITCSMETFVRASFNTWDKTATLEENSEDYDYGIEGLKKLNEGNAGLGGIVLGNMQVKDAKIDEFDAIAIPGGFGKYGYYEAGFADEILELIRGFEQAKKPIAAVCTASLLLAKSGILDGKKATTYLLHNDRFLTQLKSMGALVVTEEIVIDQNIITSSGPKTAPFVCLELLKMLFEDFDAREVAKVMGYTDNQI